MLKIIVGLSIFGLGYAVACLLNISKISSLQENKIRTFKILNKHLLVQKDYRKWLDISDDNSTDYKARKLVNKKLISEIEAIMNEFLNNWQE